MRLRHSSCPSYAAGTTMTRGTARGQQPWGVGREDSRCRPREGSKDPGVHADRAPTLKGIGGWSGAAEGAQGRGSAIGVSKNLNVL